nr:hypothetical protein [uncultured Psychroserpens sp.]
MKNIIKLFIVVLLFASCEETQPVIFDPGSGQTLATFGAASSNLQVIIDDSGSTDVTVNITTVSSMDRTVSVSVDESSSANPENYTVPSSVVIPAGEFSGILTVTGIDNSVETDVETIILNLESVEGGIVSQGSHTISIFQVCPVPADYLVGDYLLTDNGNGNFGVDVPVTISIPEDDSNARIFVAEFLPGTGVARDVDVRINLVCNTFLFQTIDINVTCTQVTSYVIGSAGADSSEYDLGDDQFVTVNYLEDVEADCGDTLVQNITLTKQ